MLWLPPAACRNRDAALFEQRRHGPLRTLEGDVAVHQVNLDIAQVEETVGLGKVQIQIDTVGPPSLA